MNRTLLRLRKSVIRFRRSWIPWVLGACLVAGVPSAPRAMAEALYDTPAYDAKNDTYYELVSLKKQYPGRYPKDVTSWEHVASLSATRVFKGRQGRLAIVASREVNDFLRDTFKPDLPAWFGLRYYCKYKKLMWVDGRINEVGNYRNFSQRWHVGGIAPTNADDFSLCSNYFAFWPVHYWSLQDGFYWNANGTYKHFGIFFVEYPPRK